MEGMKMWFKQLSDAADAYNKREGAKGGTKLRTDPGTPSTTTHLSATAAAAATAVVAGSGGASSLSTRGIADHRNDDESSTPPAQQQTQERNGNAMTDSVLSDGGSTTVAATTSGENGAAEDDAVSKRLSGADLSDEGPSTNQHPPVGSSSVTVKLEADQWALVQPSEVHVAVPPVHTAQPVLTPLEQLRRKDDEVLQALDDKKVLVAGLLSIPLQDYNNIAEMASEESMKMTEKEPIELILASVYQIDQVWRLVNASTNVDEADSVLATGGKHASCASNAATVAQHASALVPSVPTVQLEPIVKLLSSQLTTLLSVIKQGEEERLVLRKELQRTREQLHRQTVGMPTTPTIGEDPQHASQTQDFNQSGDLARIEESPTETDTT